MIMLISQRVILKNFRTPIVMSTYQRRDFTVAQAVSPLIDMCGSVWTTKLCEHVLLWTHSSLHLPWWVAILGVSVAAKVALSPLNLYAIKSSIKLNIVEQQLQPHLLKLAQEIKQKGKERNTPEAELKKIFKGSMQQVKEEVYLKNNVHPLKPIALAILQLPVWLSITLAVRNLSVSSRNNVAFFLEQHRVLSDIPHTDFADSGFLWISSFAVSDSYCLLPILLIVVNCCSMQLRKSEIIVFGKPAGTMKPRLERFHTFSTLGWTLLMSYSLLFLPSGVGFYWVSSALLSFCFSLMLKYPQPRKLFNIPVSIQEQKNTHPLRTFLKSFIIMFRQKKL